MAGTLDELWRQCTWALNNGDPRTDSWFLVHSPLPVTLLFAFYLLLVVAGPAIMSHREPLRLAGPLAAYNLGLVLLSGYIFYEFMVTSLLAKYSYFCQPVDYSQSELGIRQMASVCWWCFFSKAIELLDTVFFILRKKREQITFLHVYHHGTMLFNWWAGVKYVPGGQVWGPTCGAICGGSDISPPCSWVSLWPLLPTLPTISLLSATSRMGSTWLSSCTPSASSSSFSTSTTRHTSGASRRSSLKGLDPRNEPDSQRGL
ncbi:elongation of very long chain fatty acids protein 7-like isoform X3 [Talpa occidentalis]|uniref:elongation of very long chain fatty acids protein 7-like isoform X3 n=1 Tax=Talpa occidentalis TaxID=50954 RepID=UPI0023F93C51|nr:elongation of very long chain fatty acids protein 7-like isoform X3 [Talpa occidentalis]